MEPLGAKLDIVDVEELTRWNFTRLLDSEDECASDGAVSPFPFRTDINARVILWKGDLLKLNVHAIVHPTNEAMSERCSLTTRIFQEAGPALISDINLNVRGFKTGEARLTKGYRLLARYIIHTVGPRFNERYSTAAENALFNCYRNVLQVAKESGIRILGFFPIHSSKRGYPVKSGAHIAIRTIRRNLEKYAGDFETIVFAIEDDETMKIYQSLMPLYFPRTKQEELAAIKQMPSDIGNEEGEPVIPERQIRILDKPTMAAYNRGNDDIEETVDLNQEFGSPDGPEVGKHPFAQMQKDIDKERLLYLQSKPTDEQMKRDRRRKYEKLLNQSKTADLTEIAQHRCMYQTGVDRFGRTVLVFVGKNFPADNMDLNKAILYLMRIMDQIVDNEYVVVYFHTNTTQRNYIETGFLKYVYDTLDEKYRKNLQAFYIVHPTFWLKGVEYLYAQINPDQLDIPAFIFDYDMEINGPRYYVPQETLPQTQVDDL